MEELNKSKFSSLRMTAHPCTKEDIIEQIKEKAANYVPEWRFDTDFPDIGTALALVYAQMYARTANKFSQVWLKNRIAFLNELDAGLLPAVPATGYVTFSLVNDEAEGVELLSGTVVSAQAEEAELGVINYRTMDDLYVAPVRLETIYHTCDQEDFITQLYDSGEIWKEQAFFDLSQCSLQCHELYVSHNEALYIKANGQIRISFYLRDEIRVPGELVKILSDPGYAYFEYYSEAGYELFEQPEYLDGDIVLVKKANQPAFVKTQINGISGYFIRCTVKNIEPFTQLEVGRVMLCSWGNNIIPDMIYANGAESNKQQFLPFGERLTNFNEVYFGCQEALCKKKARVVLAFNLSFAKIPIDYNPENDPVKWNWIMKRSDFKADPEYDVTIEEVLWEYYNGTGWARLFPDHRYSNVFLPRDGIFGQYQTIEFRCPDDLEPLVVSSCESHYIRARIIKVNNLFKLKGSYISPIMEDTVFEYNYRDCETEPDYMVSINNLETRMLPKPVPGKMVSYRPFIQTGSGNQALYLGFQTALDRGPMKILFMIKDNIDRTGQELAWEYLSISGWKELNVIDETREFSTSGLVTIMGKKDFLQTTLFNRKQYWLRITDVKNSYMPSNRINACPIVQGIYINTTKVMNVDKAAAAFFRMEIYQENSRFALADKKIIQAEVYIDEINDLSSGEITALIKEKRLKPVYDETGIIKNAWVKWHQTDDFSESEEGSRHYVLDKNEGLILFGNGRFGRIPSSSQTENIRVEYLCGGGEHGNVEKHKIRQMNQEIGFINQVMNPEALAGGCNIESLNEALVRNSANIRHQYRAITARDFEEIVMAASRNIKRVKCFSGYGSQGQKCPGAVTLVVLQNDFEHRRTRFGLIKEEVENYLKDKVDGNLFSTGKLTVMEPEFVELSVRAEVTVAHYNAVFQVKKQVVERLNSFFNPLNGNFDNQGWEVGQIPNNIQIKNAIGTIPDLVYVRNIYTSAFAGDNMGRREVDLETIRRNRYILPISGQHEVMFEIR